MIKIKYLAIIIMTVIVLFFSSSLFMSSKHLKGFYLERIAIKGKEYSLNNGKISGSEMFNPINLYKIYSLSNYYKLFLEDPIIANGNLNSDEFSKNIAKISEIQKAINVNLGTSEDILPVVMLENFSKVNIAAKELKNNTSFENAQIYQKASEEFVKTYKKSVIISSDSLNKYSQNPKVKNMVAGSEFTTAKIIDEDLKLFLRNAESLENELAYRKEVLQGIKIPKTNKEMTEIKSFEKPTPPKILPVNELVSPEKYQIDTSKLYSLKSSCYDGENKDKYFYLGTKEKDNKSLFIHKYASDNFFTKVSEDNPLDMNSIKVGKNWRVIHEENSYNCLDNSFQPKLLMMKNFINKYDYSVFSRYEFEKDILNEEDRVLVEKIKKFEEEFYDNMLVISESNINSLSDNYYNLYKLSLDNNRNNKNNELLKELIERNNLIKNKLVGLETIFSDYFQLEKFLEYLPQNNSDKDILKVFTYLIRPNYSISYLSFSDLLWRINQMPKYKERLEKSPQTKRYYSYKELIDSGVAKSELLNSN